MVMVSGKGVAKGGDGGGEKWQWRDQQSQSMKSVKVMFGNLFKRLSYPQGYMRTSALLLYNLPIPRFIMTLQGGYGHLAFREYLLNCQALCQCLSLNPGPGIYQPSDFALVSAQQIVSIQNMLAVIIIIIPILQVERLSCKRFQLCITQHLVMELGFALPW